MKFSETRIKIQDFSFMTGKCRLRNGVDFVQGKLSYIYWDITKPHGDRLQLLNKKLRFTVMELLE